MVRIPDPDLIRAGSENIRNNRLFLENHRYRTRKEFLDRRHIADCNILDHLVTGYCKRHGGSSLLDCKYSPHRRFGQCVCADAVYGLGRIDHDATSSDDLCCDANV